MSFLSPSTQHCAGGSSQCTSPRKREKRVTITKEDVKFPPLVDYVIYSMENLRTKLKKLLILQLTSSVWQQYPKVNFTSVHWQWTIQKEFKNIIPSIIASKEKYYGLNLVKQILNLYVVIA